MDITASIRRSRALAVACLVPLLAVACGGAAPVDDAGTMVVAPEYRPAVEALQGFIADEMAAKSLPALSIALVQDQRVVWAEGFGMARPDDGVAATPATVYRVGSVSKLFTDIGVMQLVERGVLDLDAPVRRYLPEFQPENPFGGEITLRHLMSHRAGLVREPPAGSYFHDDAASLEETVRSLNGTRLVYPPGARTKYSNAGIAVVGLVLERVGGAAFAAYLQEAVLAPLGMESSGFEPRPDLVERLADATMWTYDNRVFPAPTFQLGMAPAGSMYASVTDLAAFLSALFAGGAGRGGAILEAATLDTMWTPQYVPAEQATGFGIGFAVDTLGGHRRIGHGGAIYGFATELAALPDEKLGVVVVTTRDMANAVTSRVADAALRLALAARHGQGLPGIETTDPVPAATARRLAGRYRSPAGRQADLIVRGDTLFMATGALRVALRARGDTLVVDDPLAWGQRILPRADALVMGTDTLRRVAVPRPDPAPARWDGLIGEYGWDHNVLYIREVDGRLHAQIEWFFSYPLEELGRDRFRFPDFGLYHGEDVVFSRDGAGRATAVVAAGIPFQRREVGTEAGETFRITPVRPVDALRRDALAATPPVETGPFLDPDLVEPVSLDPSIRLDVRYATTNNFMSAVFYDEPRVFLQRPAAEALVRAHQRLREHGYGLLLHDGYRPWYVTRMFWDATPESMKIFVANPEHGSRHNRGAAIDLSLFDLATGEPIQVVAGYDEFSDRSYPDYPGGTSLQRWNRDLLRAIMEDEGYDVYEAEWWHFDFRDWRRYPILNLRFDEIERAAAPTG